MPMDIWNVLRGGDVLDYEMLQLRTEVMLKQVSQVSSGFYISNRCRIRILQ